MADGDDNLSLKPDETMEAQKNINVEESNKVDHKEEKEKEKGIGERIMGTPSKEINIPDWIIVWILELWPDRTVRRCHNKHEWSFMPRQIRNMDKEEIQS